MPSQSRTTGIVVLFAILGLVVGVCFPGVIEWMFYTTKPFHFIDDWVIFVLIALFGVSFAMIPLASVIAQRSSATVGRRHVLWPFVGVWLVSIALTCLTLSMVTARIHHATLSFPDWLIPVGLLLVPTAGAVIVLCSGVWKARRSERYAEPSV